MFNQAHVVALNKLRLFMLLFISRVFVLYRLSLADIPAQSPPSQFTALRSHSLANIVDRTNYFDKDHTPEQAVRNIFGRQRAPTKLCLLFAKFGFLTFDRIAQLGDDPSTAGNRAKCWSLRWLLATPRSLRTPRSVPLCFKTTTSTSAIGSSPLILT